MAGRAIPAKEDVVPPESHELRVPSRLRKQFERISGAVAAAVVEALGAKLPVDARGLADLEKRLVSATAREVVAPVMRAVLVAVHQAEGFVHSCVDRTCYERGLFREGPRTVSVRLLSGDSVEITTPYACVDRSGKPGPRRGRGKHGAEGSGSYPVLAQLGVIERASPALVSEVAWTSAALGSLAEAQGALASRGIALHVNTVRLFANRFADAGLADRLETTPFAGPLPLAGKRVVVAIDGGRLRTRVPKPGRPRKETGRHGYEAVWREPKLLAVYTIDERGKKDGAFTFYEGTLASYDEAVSLFTRMLSRLGVAEAREVIFAADGSTHVWDRVPKIMAAIGLPKERLRCVVDFWHAVEHAHEAATLLPGLSAYERSLRARAFRKLLKAGRPEEVAAEITCAASSRRGDARTALANHAAYFHDNADRMRYDRLRADGLPIGTGVVESAIRRVVNLRMKGPGIFWSEENAERMLLLRSRLKAGRWRDLEDAAFARARGPHGRVLQEETLRRDELLREGRVA